MVQFRIVLPVNPELILGGPQPFDDPFVLLQDDGKILFRLGVEFLAN